MAKVNSMHVSLSLSGWGGGKPVRPLLAVKEQMCGMLVDAMNRKQQIPMNVGLPVVFACYVVSC